ncbi:hypothetical protein [Kribbella sp. C-35]|uniref:hypothetical protein n=1 Tax=Kribbella sp. C-35 TaxID=2789276 RepID=UPI00397AD887
MKEELETWVRHVIDDADGDAFRAWAKGLTSGLDLQSAENTYYDGDDDHDATPAPERLAATAITDDAGRCTVQCLAFFRMESSERIVSALTRLWEASGAGRAAHVEGDVFLLDAEVVVRDRPGQGHPQPKMAWKVKDVWPADDRNPFPAR